MPYADADVRREFKRDYHESRKGDPVYMANRRAAVKRRYDGLSSMISTIKIEAGCVDCGYNADPAALDFDHVRGTKVRNIRAMMTQSGIDAMLDEIDKCEVRCANCHRIKTLDRRAEPCR